MNANEAEADPTVPLGPLAMVVSGVVPSTVQVHVAGDGSTTPAASRARARKVCEPSVSALYETGLVHALKGAPSRLHSKVAPERFDASVKGADRLLARTGGLVTIEVSGAPPSTTWRTVRTTVPVVASRCCSQSSKATKVLGLPSRRCSASRRCRGT